MNYSTTGRPRKLTDGQISEILAWHRTKMTNAQFAKLMGIARGTLEHIIRTLGKHYKQTSPEGHRAIREERGTL